MELSKIIWIMCLLFIESSFAELQFTEPTENCVYGSNCLLTCGPIDRSKDVQFFRGGKPLLTCLARNSYESPCLTVPDSQDLGYRTYFDYRKSELIVKVQMKENDDVNWTCKNGNQEAKVHVNVGYASFVAKFTTWNNLGYEQEVGQEVTLVCQVVVSQGSTYGPSLISTSITRNSDASNLTTTVSKGYYLNYKATTKLKCTDNIFTCLTTTGFGKLSSNTVEVNVKCPMQIFYDMITTNVTIEVGKSRDLELYFSGYPVTTIWYRNFPEGDMELNRINNIIDIPIGSRKEIMFINNAKLDDAGQYTVHVRQNDTVIKVVYHVTIVTTKKPRYDKTHKTSPMSQRFSTYPYITTYKARRSSRPEQPKSEYTSTVKQNIIMHYSTSTQINKSITKAKDMKHVGSKDNNGSCKKLSNVLTLVVMAFSLFNFV